MPDNPQRPDPAWLSAAFGMEPRDAVAFLKGKGLAVSDNWAEMLDEAHARAFTVARCAQLDVLRDIRSGMLDALKNGKTFQEFKKELQPLLEKKGWWGTKKVTGPDGVERVVQLGSDRRLKTIYRTNTQTAYMAGRMKAQMGSPFTEYLQYIAVMDGVTRPAHRALNGRVYPKDDPVWASIYPPNGFNCRCRVSGLTKRDVERDGLTVEDSSGHTLHRDTEVKTGGRVFKTKQTGVRVTLENGQPGVMWTDPGFNASPLASHLFDRQLVQKAAAALGDGPEAYALAQNTVLSETRMKGWRAFVDVSRRSPTGEQQNKTMTAGILPYRVASETGFSPVLHVRDGLIMGRKGRRHAETGDALSDDEWRRLPELLRDAQWYRDTKSGNTVAVMEDVKMSAVFSQEGKADTVYRDAHIAQKIRDKLWVGFSNE
ncbi:MAG: minor capsid protein [Candidatus Hydrogenedens sp.]|nr:minor capsid protein [Candidatus Hydrogenedens sp.]